MRDPASEIEAALAFKAEAGAGARASPAPARARPGAIGIRDFSAARIADAGLSGSIWVETGGGACSGGRIDVPGRESENPEAREKKIAEFLVRLGCPLLVRPAGLLEMLQGREGLELTGDFSLNAANALSARMLLDHGLSRLTPAHDLNAAQVAALGRRIGGALISCGLSPSAGVPHRALRIRPVSFGWKTYLDCGRPCENHRVELRDERGRAHPVLAATRAAAIRCSGRKRSKRARI